jgi:hypothetical protein
MAVVSVITEPEVIDRILKHLAETGAEDPHEGREPPPADELVAADVPG